MTGYNLDRMFPADDRDLRAPLELGDITLLRLPWNKPPLTMNGREHWSKRAQITRQIRTASRYLCNGLGAVEAVQVTLTYYPKDRRVRDADNLIATYKPVCDGIVDAGIVPDDDPAHMVKVMPVIAAADSLDPRMVVAIEVVSPPDAPSAPLAHPEKPLSRNDFQATPGCAVRSSPQKGTP